MSSLGLSDPDIHCTSFSPSVPLGSLEEEEEGGPTANTHPGGGNTRGPLRHDSIDLWEDDVRYTIAGTSASRCSFSFGNTRQRSVISPTTKPSNQVPSFPLPLQSSSWTLQLVWMSENLSSLANIVFPWRAYRAEEWCDYDSTPLTIRQTCQNVLTKQWTRKLEPLQRKSPAVTACEQLAEVIDDASRLVQGELEVFEFCAGSGGPTPVFEQQINESRRTAGDAPLHFCISDLHPNPAAWREHTSRSEYLSVIEESVDATNPPACARR
jgi:hypothetical protein